MTEIENKSQKAMPKNFTEKAGLLFKLLGAVTRKTHPKKELSVARSRAVAYNELTKLRLERRGSSNLPTDRERIILETEKRRKILHKEFTDNQMDLEIRIQEYGHLSARCVTLDGTPYQEDSSDNSIPIVLIPGISGDLETVKTFAIELALRGKKVIVIGYPESNMGVVTQQYTDKTEESLRPQENFFSRAIQKILPEGNFELWAHSTGCPISARIASSYLLKDRVEKLALVAPIGCVDSSINKLIMGGIVDVKNLITMSPPDVARYGLIGGSTGEVDPEQQKMKAAIMNHVMKLIVKRLDEFEKISELDKCKTAVWIGKKDTLTHASLATDSLRAQGAHVIEGIGTHNRFVTHPEEVVEAILNAF